MSNGPVRIGVDLGGTKIEVIAPDCDGQVLLRRRMPTPRDDYPATLVVLVELVESFERELGQRGTVGIATPGALSPATGLIKNANSVWLNGRPLADDLERRLGRPLRFANDANCFALSEARDGAAAGARAVFGVIVGTGTGGGLETFLSGPGLARDHREATRGPCVAAPGNAERDGGHSDRPPDRRWRLSRSRPAPPGATRGARPRSGATRTGWRARSLASSTSWTPTSSSLAAAWRT